MDPEILSRWEVNGKGPRSALIIAVEEVFLHCGKALIRSRLWHDDTGLIALSSPHTAE